MKTVVYTCIIGGYDELLQPVQPSADFDYVCFVGRGEKISDRIGVWQIREFDCAISDPGLRSRYPKMHPHILLSDYDASLWIDGNIEVLDDSLWRAVRIKEAAGVKYSGVAHPSRTDVFQEARMCYNMHYISAFRLLRVWVWQYLHGMRRGSGLMENNIIFRLHNDADVIVLDEMWWRCVMRIARRDQLSLMPCLRRCGIPRDYLLPRAQNSRNHPGLRYLPHK